MLLSEFMPNDKEIYHIEYIAIVVLPFRYHY